MRFDEIIEGGFHEKSISVYLAETRRGKTLIQVGLASNCILNNKNVRKRFFRKYRMVY